MSAKKLTVGILLLLGFILQASADQQLGFVQSATLGPILKLDGFTMQSVQGGYLALSVPPKEMEKFILVAARLETHLALLAVIEHLENETQKVVPLPGAPTVPIGVFFLATNEVFLHRHKILNRNVQSVGTYTYLNLHDKTITVSAYEGGPNSH